MTTIYIVHRIKGKTNKIYDIYNTLHNARSSALMGEQTNDGYSYVVYEYVYEDYKPLRFRKHSLVGNEPSDWQSIRYA